MSQDVLETFKKSVYSSVAYCSYADDEEDRDGDEEVEGGTAALTLFYQQDRTCLLK